MPFAGDCGDERLELLHQELRAEVVDRAIRWGETRAARDLGRLEQALLALELASRVGP